MHTGVIVHFLYALALLGVDKDAIGYLGFIKINNEKRKGKKK